MAKTGLEVLKDSGFSKLNGLKVAILANQASVDREFNHVLDLAMAYGIKVVKLFAPEHGFSGVLQDMEHVGKEVHKRYNLPIISLYGDHKDSLKLKAEHLDGIDVLLCDLPDIGSRYYTFHCTLAFAMKACEEKGVKLLVLDRPNPINAHDIEGNLVKDHQFSFVGAYPLPNRHGFTIGEIASYVKDFYSLSLDLEIVKMADFDRKFYLDELKLPFIQPSPNMPSLDTAIVYPGMCLIEGTNLSEGRGTTTPFLAIGAPYIDGQKFKAKIDEMDFLGIKTRCISFKPQFQKHAQKNCEGIFLHITDRKLFRPVRFALGVIKAAMTFKGFSWRVEPYEYETTRLAINLLLGDENFKNLLEREEGLNSVFNLYKKEEELFAKTRYNYLIY